MEQGEKRVKESVAANEYKVKGNEMDVEEKERQDEEAIL